MVSIRTHDFYPLLQQCNYYVMDKVLVHQGTKQMIYNFIRQAQEYGAGKDPPPKDSPGLDSEILIASERQHMVGRALETDYEGAQSPPSSHRSQDDETLDRLFSGIGSWAFDIFQINEENLPKMVERIFKELGLFDAFPLDIRKFRAFTRAMVARYQPNPYHNFRHACDVLHASFLILTATEAGKKLTHLEKFALALAALCHDVDHPGLTNAFLSTTYDPLALRYNDRGVLENHHAATCFITMRGHDAVNLLSALNEVEQRHMRKLMLTIILATDMEAHSRILREFTERVARPDPFELSPPYTPPGSLSPLREEFNSFASTPPGSPPSTSGEEKEDAMQDSMGGRTDTSVKVYKNPLQSAPPMTSSGDVLLLLQMIIKCADLSNVVKPFFLSKRWSALLLLEWFRQGEIERQLGLPISKFMDREDPTTLMAMTCGCIDYIAKPMYEATAKLLPKLQEEVLMNLSFNRSLWTQFSTHGRRASETAAKILGPFAPPPVPKFAPAEEEFEIPLATTEEKLVATFNGQYVAVEPQPSVKVSNKSQTKPVPSIPAEMDSATSDQSHEPSEHAKQEGDAALSENLPVDVVHDEKAEDEIHVAKPADAEKAVDDEHFEKTMLNMHAEHVEKLVDAEKAVEDEHVEKPVDAVHVEKRADTVHDEKLEGSVHDEKLQDVATHHVKSKVVEEFATLDSDVPQSDVKSKVVEEFATLDSDVPQSETGEEHAAQSKPAEEYARQEGSEVNIATTLAPLMSSTSSVGSVEESQAEEAPESEAEPEPETVPEEEFRGFPTSEAPLSLLFGMPSESLQGKGDKGKDQESMIPGLLPSANLLIVDRNKKSIDAMAFRVPANVSQPTGVRAPSFKSGVIDRDAEKGKTVVPQPPVHVGFWEAIRTHPKVARLNRAMEDNVWNFIFIVATLFALFADDVVKGFLPKAADVYEAHLLTACLVLFLLEGLILSIFRDGYFISFFFWLDLLGSLTLVPIIIGINSQNLVLARTGRAAKTITRASKVLQASHIQAQIARLIPIARLIKFVGQFKESSVIDSDDEGEEHVSTKPSQLWTRLSELTTQKLILGVLIIIIVYPYFGTEKKDLGPLVSLDGLDYYPLQSVEFTASFKRVLIINDNHGYEIQYLGVQSGCLSPPGVSIAGCTGITDNNAASAFEQLIPDPLITPNGRAHAQQIYRPAELISVTSDSTRAQAYYSIRKQSKLKHGMNIALTVLVLAILALWCFFLSRDSNHLLIQPIERMVQFVKELAEDPVSFAGKTMTRPTADKAKVMETFFVEAALVKIASLTKVALGDAGMDILSVNLKGAEFNPMLPGKKIRACFGFCDIRNFTDATECLQEDVMMFVNRIADVVHNKVVLHSGFPNKNIGDAFLIVWKKTVSDNTNKARATSFADRALRSFLDIIQCIETSQSLAEFAKHPAIQKRMPGYRIHMGFGLHVGWAIEGAIGSAHKVDPSYLSPHVNMASRLEAATKQYGVMLLISETVIAHLTKSSLRDSCRKLDRVTVKGSHEPMVLYTFDIPLFQQELKCNPAEYRDIFEEAVGNYIDGEWTVSLEKLEECAALWPTDKPVKVLQNFMASHNYTVPADWQGFRELTEK